MWDLTKITKTHLQWYHIHDPDAVFLLQEKQPATLLQSVISFLSNIYWFFPSQNMISKMWKVLQNDLPSHWGISNLERLCVLLCICLLQFLEVRDMDILTLTVSFGRLCKAFKYIFRVCGDLHLDFSYETELGKGFFTISLRFLQPSERCSLKSNICKC